MFATKFSTLVVLALLAALFCNVAFAADGDPVIPVTCDPVTNKCDYYWACAPTEATLVADQTASLCSNTDYSQWTATAPATAGGPTEFTRGVKCVGTIDDKIIEVVDATQCPETQPVASFKATGTDLRQCLQYGPGAEYTTCPVAAALTDDEKVKFCTGHAETIAQQCSVSYTYTVPTTPVAPEPIDDGAAPFVTLADETPVVITISTAAVACVAPQLVSTYDCPVYLPKCTNKFRVSTPAAEGEGEGEGGDDEDTKDNETQAFDQLHHDESDDDAEVTCQDIVPVCPSCNKHDIPLIGGWTALDLAPKVSLRCYVKTPVTPVTPPSGEGDEDDDSTAGGDEMNLAHSEEDDPNFHYVLVSTLTDTEREICLRGGSLTTDPETLPPAPTCPEITTCPYFTCRPAGSAEAVPYTFAACYAESLSCAKTQSLPTCVGAPDIQSKCFDLGAEVETTTCAAITQYEAPGVAKPCEPTNCPAFSFKTDALVVDETDTDFGDEETTSDAYIAIEGTVLTATLSNLEISESDTWGLDVYKRTFTTDDKKVKIFVYTKVTALSQTGLTTGTATVTVDATNLAVGEYFVLRAQYKTSTFVVEEGSSGECEILNITNVIPADPPTCEKTDDDKDGQVKTTADKKEGEEKSTDVEDALAQKPGREKLVVVATGCRLFLGDNCDNGSTCQKQTEDAHTTYSCSACKQAFTGQTCGTCDLTNLCLNGSKPYAFVPPVNEVTPSPGAFRVTQSGETAPPKTEDEPEAEEESIDNSSNGQCYCECPKAFTGVYCQCSAVYGRLDFKAPLTTTEGQTQDQWAAQLTTQIATVSKIPEALFTLHHVSPLKKAYIIYALSACATQAQSEQFFAALQSTTETTLNRAEVSTRWAEFKSADMTTVTAASQAGGISTVSAAYDPTCVGDKCTGDVTDAAYDPSPAPSTDEGAKGSSSNVWWIILIILGIVVLVIIAIGAIRYFLSSNKKKSFGTSSDSELDMAEIS